MAVIGGSKVVLYVLNVLHAILGLIIATLSIWFFIRVYEFTSLRNDSHYMLDYTVYWPQAIPWIYFFVGVLVLCVSCCGFASAGKGSRSVLFMYMTFLSCAVIALIAAAVVSLVFADSKSTDDFVKDTVWDVYSRTQNDPDAAEAYGLIERRIQCCGADSPRDYKKWKTEFPMSCCDTYSHGWMGSYVIDCEITNKLANERHGCSAVATQYARIIIRVFSGLAIFTAVIGIVSMIVAMMLSKALKEKTRLPAPHPESDSKKVLL